MIVPLMELLMSGCCCLLLLLLFDMTVLWILVTVVALLEERDPLR